MATALTTTVKAECGTVLHAGDRAYDYYSMKPGKLPAQIGEDGWFSFEHDAGTQCLLNGQRICSLAHAARMGWPGAAEALTRKAQHT